MLKIQKLEKRVFRKFQYFVHFSPFGSFFNEFKVFISSLAGFYFVDSSVIASDNFCFNSLLIAFPVLTRFQFFLSIISILCYELLYLFYFHFNMLRLYISSYFFISILMLIPIHVALIIVQIIILSFQLVIFRPLRRFFSCRWLRY